jgi:hypothetical protein
MRTKWMVIGGAVVAVAVAVLLVVGQSLMTGREPAALPSNSGSGMRAATATVGPAGSLSAGAPTTPVGTKPAVTPPAPLPRSQAGLKPVAPSGPAAAGQPLPPLSASPSDLVSGFRSGTVPSGSAYDVILRPWGMGPVVPQGRTAVVTVYSVTPLFGAPASFATLKSRALLVVMDAKAGGTLERGGTYAAVLRFVAAGGRLVPVLSRAKLNGS